MLFGSTERISPSDRRISVHTPALTGRILFQVILMVAVVAVTVLILLPFTPHARGDGYGDYPPPKDGDWVIGKDTYVGNETIELSGNLIINRFGSLTLRNVTLIFMNDQTGQYGIEVRPQGNLMILDGDDDPATMQDRSVIRPNKQENPFTFLVEAGASFSIRNSEVRSSGYQWAHDGSSGLTIAAKDAVVENTRFVNCYHGVNVQGEYCTITGSVMTGNTMYGIYLSYEARFAEVRNCTAEGNNNGIGAYGSDSTIDNCHVQNNDNTGIRISASRVRITGCTVTSNGNAGIELSNALECEVRDCTVIGNTQQGLYQDWYSTYNTIADSRFFDNPVGMFLMKDYYGTVNVTGCTVRNSSTSGIELLGSDIYLGNSTVRDSGVGIRVAASENLIEGCEASGNDVGFEILWDAGSNRFLHCTALGNTNHDFHSPGNAGDNTFHRLTLSSAVISFSYGHGIGISGLAFPPSDPPGRVNIGSYLLIKNLTETVWIDLEIHYTATVVRDVLESTLRLYRFSHLGAWEEIPSSRVVTDDRFVTANITSSGDLGRLGVFGEPIPFERSVRNRDTGLAYYFIQYAIDAPETKDGHTILVDPRKYRENIRGEDPRGENYDGRNGDEGDGRNAYRENVDIHKEVRLTGKGMIDAMGGRNSYGIRVLVNNVHIENLTILNGTYGVTVLDTGDAFSEIRNVNLLNLTILNCTTGIQLRNTHGGRIIRCTITESSAAGILLEDSTGNLIRDCNATGTGGDGLRMVHSHNTTVSDSEFSDCPSTGVRLENSDNNTFTNVITARNDRGFHLYHSNRNLLTHCRALDNRYQGFHIHSTLDGVANHNHLIGCIARENEEGIIIEGDRFKTDLGSNHNQLTDCTVSENRWLGIWLWGADHTIIQRTRLSDNQVGIDISYTSSGTRIENSSISSSGDPDVRLRNDAVDSLALNTTFSTVDCDDTSSLLVRNYLHILTRDALGNPLAGADLLVRDITGPAPITVYATPQYGGKDERTDARGLVTGILVTDRGYFGSSKHTDIENNVTAVFGDEVMERTVDMETSRLEIFTFRFKLEAFIDSMVPNRSEEGEPVEFRARGIPVDRVVRYVWRSSRDGEFSNGTAENITYAGLSPGNHTIFLRVGDDQGLWSAEVQAFLPVKNLPPVAVIRSIIPTPAHQGDLITFNGSGTDTLGPVLGYLWHSSLVQEPLSRNSTFSTRDLEPGNHTISFMVMDDEGTWSSPATAVLVINARPVALIGSITPAGRVQEGETVTFNGSGSDPDGSIVAYRWTSSLQGLLGTDPVFSTTGLLPGEHVIELSVQDDHGAWSPPATWNLTIVPPVAPTGNDWFVIEIHRNDDDTRITIEITLTPLGKQHIVSITEVRLWITSPAMERTLLHRFPQDNSAPDPVPQRYGETLFSDQSLVPLGRSDVIPTDLHIRGTLHARLLPNDRYTIEVEALADRPTGLAGPPLLLNSTRTTLLLEHPRNLWGPVLGSAGLGVALGGVGELLRGKGSVAAEGAADAVAADGKTKPFRLRSKIKRKLLVKNHLFTFLTFTIAVILLVLSFGYTMMVSPGRDARKNLRLFDSVVLDPASPFRGDILTMLPYLLAVMGIIILFRLWVDWLASRAQGIETAFRPHLSGVISLGLTTMLFGTPYGYPAQSIHDSRPQYMTKESRIAGARIMGVLVLLVPFWAAWTYLGSYRFFSELGLWLVLMCAFTISLPLGDSEGRMVWRKSVRMGMFLLLLTAGIYFGWQLLYLPNGALPVIGVGAAILLPLFLLPAPLDGPLEEDTIAPVDAVQPERPFTPPSPPVVAGPTCNLCGNTILENALPCPVCSSPMRDIDPRALRALFLGNMRNVDPRVRSATLTAMTPYLLRNHDLQPLIEDALGDTDGLVRQAALRTLAPFLGDSGELLGKIGPLMDDGLPFVRQVAMEVLSPYLGTNEFLFPAFRRTLFDLDEHVRTTAIRALAPFLPQREDLIGDFRTLMDEGIDSLRSAAMGAVTPLFSGSPWLRDLLFGGKKARDDEPPAEPQVPRRICPGCGEPMEPGWRSCPFCAFGREQEHQFRPLVRDVPSPPVTDIDRGEIALAAVRRATGVLGHHLARNSGGMIINGGNSVILPGFDGGDLVTHTGGMALTWMGRDISVDLPVDAPGVGRQIVRIHISPELREGTGGANVTLEGNREVLDRWGGTLRSQIWDAVLDSIAEGELDVGDGDGFRPPAGVDPSFFGTSIWPFQRTGGNISRMSCFVFGGGTAQTGQV